MLPAMQFLANLGVLWHFFWQFLFLVGWPTLANVCQRYWLANILDSLPTGSEKIVKEPEDVRIANGECDIPHLPISRVWLGVNVI